MAERYQINKDAAEWRLVDGEAVIVNVENGHYYALNHTGTLVWTLLDGGASPHEVAARVADEYDIAVERARVDVGRVIDELVGEGLIREH
jgi:outer membrane protein assembly factor BamB